MALLLALVPFFPAAAVPGVSGVEVRPSHFSPNGDGRNDTADVFFTPEGGPAAIAVDVTVERVADGFLMATLLSGAALPAGTPASATWMPGTAADGRYRFRIVVTEGAVADTADAEVDADSTPPVVSLGVVGPSPFDPALETLGAEVRVATDAGTVTRVEIRDGAAARIDSLGVITGPDSVSFTWDGKIEGAADAPTGTYTVTAVAVDLAGNTAQASRSVTLDRDDPAFSLDTPDTLQTDLFPVLLTGVATDGDRVTAVEASFDTSATFGPADTVSAAADTVSFVVIVDDPSPVPGFRTVVLRATDDYGHTGETEVVVAWDTLLPAATSSTWLDADGRATDGDSVVIETIWNQAGLALSADFGDLDNGFTAGDEDVTDEGTGRYRIGYRISDTNSRPAGPWEVVLRASTGVLTGADTVTVVLVDAHENQLVTVNRNRFDPLAGEEVRIAADGASAAVNVDIFDLSGQRVIRLEGSGFVDWDGVNEAGGPVASGTYLLRVTVNGAEEIRKVAVLRGGSR